MLLELIQTDRVEVRSYTRGQILLERPKDEVFDAAIEACKKNKWKVKNADKANYQIEARIPLSWIEVGSNVQIFLTDDKQYGNTLLDIYINFPGNLPGTTPRVHIVKRFFDALAKNIPLTTTNYNVELVNRIRPEEEIRPEETSKPTKAIDPALALLWCTVCNRNKFSFSFQKGIERLCRICFEQKFGKTLLAASNAEYHGGHKAYLVGGMFSEFQMGTLVMTEKYLFFQTNDKNLEKRWEIIIPFEKVIVGGWSVQEVTRRKQITGGGGSIDINRDGRGDIGLGGGFIHERGKAHRLVVPYVDQNGIPQEPRFGISSFGGKAIREWSAKLYERVVEAKKIEEEQAELNKQQKDEEHLKSQQFGRGSTGQATTTGSNEDPVTILKIRLAKGEITKEQYDELRRVFES